MENNKLLQILLFAFGLLFAVIGYLAVDKLTDININMREIKVELKELRVENSRQDIEIMRNRKLILEETEQK